MRLIIIFRRSCAEQFRCHSLLDHVSALAAWPFFPPDVYCLFSVGVFIMMYITSISGLHYCMFSLSLLIRDISAGCLQAICTLFRCGFLLSLYRYLLCIWHTYAKVHELMRFRHVHLPRAYDMHMLMYFALMRPVGVFWRCRLFWCGWGAFSLARARCF